MSRRAISMTLLLALAGCGTPGGYNAGGGVSFNRPDGNPMRWGGYVTENVPNADPKTFVALSINPPFAKDARHAFYGSNIIAGADPATFRQLGSTRYSTDGAAIFYAAHRVAEADVASFRTLADNYAIDAHATYESGIVLPGVRGELTALGNGYQRDEAGHVFRTASAENGGLRSEPVDVCDPASFHVGQTGPEPEAWDNQCVYARGKRIPLIDRASFRHLGGFWSKDSGGVYYLAMEAIGADPATFDMMRGPAPYDEPLGRDASGRCWSMGQPLACPAGAQPWTYPGLAPASIYAPNG